MRSSLGLLTLACMGVCAKPCTAFLDNAKTRKWGSEHGQHVQISIMVPFTSWEQGSSLSVDFGSMGMTGVEQCWNFGTFEGETTETATATDGVLSLILGKLVNPVANDGSEAQEIGCIVLGAQQDPVGDAVIRLDDQVCGDSPPPPPAPFSPCVDALLKLDSNAAGRQMQVRQHNHVLVIRKECAWQLIYHLRDEKILPPAPLHFCSRALHRRLHCRRTSQSHTGSRVGRSESTLAPQVA